jgi:hypothetical protein
MQPKGSKPISLIPVFIALIIGAAIFAQMRYPIHAAPAQGAQAAATTSAGCCTADAQKQLAASLGFVDIVGIKLGMSPAEVTAALKANSPTLGVRLYTTRMTMPSDPMNFVKVPHYIVAHKSPAPAKDYSEEYIIVEFTLPPNPPVADKVYRKLQFGTGQGVAVGTLVSAMQKKYGTETDINSIWHHWIFQNSGQRVTAALKGTAAACEQVNGNTDGSFSNAPVNDGNSDTEWNISQITLQTTDPQNDPNDIIPQCDGYVSVLGMIVAPNPGDPTSVATATSVAMQSAALVHNSGVATHNWMQADLDAKNKKATAAGAAQPAPKF